MTVLKAVSKVTIKVSYRLNLIINNSLSNCSPDVFMFNALKGHLQFEVLMEQKAYNEGSHVEGDWPLFFMFYVHLRNKTAPELYRACVYCMQLSRSRSLLIPQLTEFIVCYMITGFIDKLVYHEFMNGYLLTWTFP